MGEIKDGLTNTVLGSQRLSSFIGLKTNKQPLQKVFNLKPLFNLMALKFLCSIPRVTYLLSQSTVAGSLTKHGLLSLTWGVSGQLTSFGLLLFCFCLVLSLRYLS